MRCSRGSLLAGMVAMGVTHASDVRADAPQTGSSLAEGQHFALDPVSDGAITAVGLGFSGLLELVLSTGEIRPPSPAIQPSGLLPFDRFAVTQHVDPNASTISNIILYAAVGFAALDPVLSGLRDGWDAALVDVFMYAESLSLTFALTDVTKIAVRRPRPVDYQNCAPDANGNPNTSGNCNATDLGLSFFSGHASIVAAIGATATYIAFVRSPNSPRPWITLAAAALLTGWVSYERVRSGAHFPTDVVAGSMAGAAIGVIVPHLHRHKQQAPPVWVGIAPVPGGATLELQGLL
jgi:membrane-associated phospholipid phosphatase